MPNINLILEQRQAVKRDERKARAFFLCFAASAVVSLIGVGALLFMTEQVKGEEAQLKANAQKIQPVVEELASVKGEYFKLMPRVQTLQDARTMTDRWSHVLDHLMSATPSQAWLTSVRSVVADPKQPIQITFSGLAVKQEVIGDFMLALQQSPDLENVNLSYTQEKPVAAGSQLEFQFQGSLKGTEMEKASIVEEEN